MTFENEGGNVDEGLLKHACAVRVEDKVGEQPADESRSASGVVQGWDGHDGAYGTV